MKAKILSVAIGLITFSGAYAQSSDSAQRMVSPRIVGGSPADKVDWPFMTYLKRSDGYSCGGSYIGGRYVLTAAHCVYGLSASDLSLYVGLYDLNDKDTSHSRLAATAYYMHPGYRDGGVDNDIAIIELENDIVAPKVNLASFSDANNLTTTDVFSVAGWGRLSENGFGPDQLHQVDIPFVDKATCQNIGKIYEDKWYYSDIGDDAICAGLEDGGKDSCEGDSGGPLVIKENGGYKQYGVVSWGDGCARDNAYGVYANVGYFNQSGKFIEKYTAGVSYTQNTIFMSKAEKRRVSLPLTNRSNERFDIRSITWPDGVTEVANSCTTTIEIGDTCTIDVDVDAAAAFPAGQDTANIQIETDHTVVSELSMNMVYITEKKQEGSGKSGGSTSLAMILLAMFGFGLRAKRQR
ncbi:serine protease [Vibrio sp. Of14-4]|uniref:serine protease n=1 Tax=Vibrio sp. Of14-4 TaxID=2724878 RepID=UPI001EF21A2A|nr:serine protease [Vibrio sp. Of14-4]MCG7488028.1 serine protease [Vibrio sp. Of14-4]